MLVQTNERQIISLKNRLVTICNFLHTGVLSFELDTLGTIAWFINKAGAFVFGSGLAIVPFLHAGVVTKYGWLTEHEFIDAIAIAMITPGPVVITAGFIGYLVADPGCHCCSIGNVFTMQFVYRFIGAILSQIWPALKY